MNYEEYLKTTGSNSIIWMKGENRISVKLPYKSGRGCYELDLQNTKRPVLAVGNTIGLKDLIEIELLRNYHPSMLRITEICTDEGTHNPSPLFDRTLNMKRYIVPGDIQQLNAYLVNVLFGIGNILNTQSTGHDVHNVVILSGILRGVVFLERNSEEDKQVAMDFLRKLSALAKEKDVTIIFMEDELVRWVDTVSILRDFVGMCFSCTAGSSQLLFGTDIGATLSGKETFYLRGADGDLDKCSIPELSQDEIDNILTRIICSR